MITSRLFSQGQFEEMSLVAALLLLATGVCLPTFDVYSDMYFTAKLFRGNCYNEDQTPELFKGPYYNRDLKPNRTCEEIGELEISHLGENEERNARASFHVMMGSLISFRVLSGKRATGACTAFNLGTWS